MQLDVLQSVGVFGTGIAVCVVGRWVLVQWRAIRARDAARRDANREINEKILQALVSINQPNTEDSVSNQLLAGTVKACEAIAQATSELRNEVVEFRKLIANPPQAEYPKDALETPTEEDAVVAASRFESILRGMTPEEADQRAKDIEEKKTMLSAVSLGMGEQQ